MGRAWTYSVITDRRAVLFPPHHASWLVARALRPFINHAVTLREFVWKRQHKHLIFLTGRLKTHRLCKFRYTAAHTHAHTQVLKGTRARMMNAFSADAW